MALVHRHSIGADPGIEASGFDHPLFAVVAGMAERLNGAESKLVPITFVRLDVVDDGGHRVFAAGKARSAKGLGLQLKPFALLPHSQIVPGIPSGMARGHSFRREIGSR